MEPAQMSTQEAGMISTFPSKSRRIGLLQIPLGSSVVAEPHCQASPRSSGWRLFFYEYDIPCANGRWVSVVCISAKLWRFLFNAGEISCSR